MTDDFHGTEHSGKGSINSIRRSSPNANREIFR